MTDPEIDALLWTPDRLAAAVRDAAACARGYPPSTNFPPALFVHAVNKDKSLSQELYVLLTDFNEDAEKRDLLRHIGQKCYEEKRAPLAAVLAAECWHSVQRIGTIAPHVEPRHDPARQEGLVIMGVALGGAACSIYVPVTRDGRNHIVPGEAEALVSAGVRVPLLQHLFAGFFDALTAKMRN